MATCKLFAIALLTLGMWSGAANAADDGAAKTPDPAAPIEQSTRPHHVYLVGSLLVLRPWIDLSRPNGSVPGYLVVENRSGTPDRLIAATVAGSEAVVPDVGTPGGLPVPANGRLVLNEQGPHLVLRSGVAAAPDGLVEGTLVFAHAGTLHLSFATNGAESQEDDQTSSTPDSVEPLQQ